MKKKTDNCGIMIVGGGMQDLFTKVEQAVFRVQLAREKMDMFRQEIETIAAEVRPDILFLKNEIINKYLGLEFTVFMPGWIPCARLDEAKARVVIVHIQKGDARIVFTTQGWSYQPCGLPLREMFPPRTVIDSPTIRKFCRHFYDKYGVKVEFLAHSITANPKLPEVKSNG